MTLEKSYSEFIALVVTKNLKITYRNDISYYHLIAKDGVVFYETYIIKNGNQEQLDFEANYLASSSSTFLDVSFPVVNSNGLFSKVFTNIVVLAKNEYGDPTSIKSVYNGVDVQLVNILYDDDGDFQSANVSDL